MNVLATGVTGFIGSKFCAYFGGVHRSVIRNKVKSTGDDFFKIDSLGARTNWTGAFNNIDVVVHFAGLAHGKSFKRVDYLEVNTKGTLHLASSAAEAGVKRFVFISSIGVSGKSTEKGCMKATDKPNPSNNYSESKLLAEIGLREISRQTGLEVVIIRPVLVYGDGAPGNFGILTKLVKNVRVLPFRALTNKRNFISVNNLSDFVATCIAHPSAANQTFIISDGVAVSTQDFVKSMAKAMNRLIVQIYIPVTVLSLIGYLLGRGSQIEQLVGDLEVDSSPANELLGWSPIETMSEAMRSMFSGH